ncbi:MAG: hypothetical protein M4579_000111, partial [Chaenotheca gracillima]
MFVRACLLTALALPFAQAAETVLGVYIFSRHGDRTDKSHPPSNLTDLGYSQVFTSGQWFRNRYVSSSASSRIAGVNTDVVKQSQIVAQAPEDNVLWNSASGFLQGLYPPVGSDLGSQKLRNGSTVQSPLNGFQIIPIHTVATGTGSEDSAWLQGSSNCAKAMVSSNDYFTSEQYMNLSASTTDFYKGLAPVINQTFSDSQTSFKNAYTIFDLINVANIHNASIPSSDLLTNDTLFQVRTLADSHEYNLAYNASDSVRAIAGSTMAAQILASLNTTVTSAGKNNKINIQFGAYGGFQSFFGLAQLPAANPDFYGVPDYASTMTFELFTTGAASPFPAPQDIQVRFLFHNGTTSNSSTPVEYPLFGQKQTTLPWQSFADQMNKFAVGDQQDWCKACGNTTGVCASASTGSSPASTSSQDSGSSSGGGMSRAVAGVIGAMVTLAVILGAEVLIMLLAGLRLAKKRRP